jgi:hypothetical protein
MIGSKILQGHRADVQRELSELIERLEDCDYDVTHFKLDLSTCSNGIGIVTTVMVVWEQIDVEISDEEDA